MYTYLSRRTRSGKPNHGQQKVTARRDPLPAFWFYYLFVLFCFLHFGFIHLIETVPFFVPHINVCQNTNERKKKKKKKRNYNTTKLDVLHFSFFIFNWNIVWFTNLWTEIIIYLCLNCVCAFYDNQSLFLVFVRYIFFHIFWTIHFKPFEKFILHFISSMEKKKLLQNASKIADSGMGISWRFIASGDTSKTYLRSSVRNQKRHE